VTRIWALLCVAAIGAVLTGCSASSGSGQAAYSCGSTYSAAGVPVIIKIAKGSVACSTALSVENKYTTLVKSGDVPGNGGGAPVSVNGWTCQGYLTPRILATGDASECRRGSTEIVAVLPPLPTPTATS
jgi:hypothetical protein